MPLIKIEHIADTTLLGLWEATEPDTFFQPLPQGYLTGFSADFSAKRKKEFLASRYLLCNLLQDETAVLSRSEQGQLRIVDSTWRSFPVAQQPHDCRIDQSTV
ncbi:MAG: hypothetical protein KatS3mg031_0443 [Chitinophagales bacterium]|nr:MAG: hypothetical protein KatS3mg031_0443 [Chitinophagales bacterium]